MSEPWCPTLRPGVVYQPGDGGGSFLWDPVFRRQVGLGPVAAALVQRMDGQRPAEALVAEAAEAAAEERETAEHGLRTLLLLNLLAGSGTEIVARMRRLRAGELPALRVLPETRFACQGSGDCCQSFAYGPLPPEDRARLEQLPLREAFPQFGDGPYLDEREVEGGVHYYLRSQGDRCIFLMADCRCGLHTRFGEEAKPLLCRAFPLHYVATLDGLRVFDRGECSQYSASSRSGAALAEDPGRLVQILPAGLDYVAELEHPVVLLDDKTPCDAGHFLPLQDALCDLLGEAPSAVEGLRQGAALLKEFRAALHAFPLEPGEPDRTVAAVVARRPAGGPAGATAAAGLEAAVFLAGELLRDAGFRIAAADQRTGTSTSVRDTRRFATVIHALRLLAADRAGLLDAPLPEPYARMAAVDATDAEIDGLMRQSLRQQVFGGRALLEGRPVAALLRMALGYLVIIVGAKGSAAASGRLRALPADFDQGHLLAMRLLRTQGASEHFLAHAERAWDLVEAAPLFAPAAG